MRFTETDDGLITTAWQHWLPVLLKMRRLFLKRRASAWQSQTRLNTISIAWRAAESLGCSADEGSDVNRYGGGALSGSTMRTAKELLQAVSPPAGLDQSHKWS